MIVTGQLADIETLMGRDVPHVRPRLASCLRLLGWAELLGKQRGGEQTLLEHALAVVDVLLACIPFFAAEARPELAEDELWGMLIAAVAHDAGKADPAFQAYLRGHSTTFAEHVSSDAIRTAVHAATEALGVDASRYIDDIVSEALLHDRRMRSNRGELIEWSRDHLSPRWRKLADFVNHADSLASADNIVAAEAFLRRNPLLVGTASIVSYQVQVRGVSTTFLHAAAADAFDDADFRPIVFYEDGTLFAGQAARTPTKDAVEAKLRASIDRLFGDRREQLPELTVGQPLQDFLPRPDYVRRELMDDLLTVASTRVKRKQAASTPAQQTKRDKELATWKKQWAKEKLGEGPNDAEVQALFDLGPEACLFKIAKELIKKVLAVAAGTSRAENLQRCAREAFEARFGRGSFEPFMSQSTFMPVHDYALCVRQWHRLTLDGHLVGKLEPARRADALRQRLLEVLDDVLTARTDPLPSELLVETWARSIAGDLSLEGAPATRTDVERQLEGYGALKTPARIRAKSPLQCAQCASLIEPGHEQEASAALGNVGSFSNRRLAFDKPGQPPLCRRCVLDLALGQLCLARIVEVVIALVPRRSVGPFAAAEVVRRIRELRSVVDRQLAADTADAVSYVALSNPPDALRFESLADCAVRPVGADKRRKRTKDLAKTLSERLGEDGLDDLNAECGTHYASVDDLAQALADESAPASIRADGDVRAAVSAVVGGGRIDFASVTPNLIVVALDRQLNADSDAERALYSFGLATVFALELDMACVVGPVAELRTALASRAGRTVYVPANGPARRLLGGDWMGLSGASRWLRALRAAIVLKQRAGANTVLEILRYPSAGYAVRRIEQQERSAVGPKDWPHIEALKEVLA